MPRAAVAVLFAVQLLCAAVVLWDIADSIFGFRDRPIPWELREVIELGAATGLVLGLLLGALLMRRLWRRTERAETQLRAASGAFMELMAERFDEWGLTPAERDVALFAIKGMSTAEIAALRQTSEGTVKAQTAAIYRKAGVNGRPQLVSLFVEDLMHEELIPRHAAE